jgi:hypothetical protein
MPKAVRKKAHRNGKSEVSRTLSTGNSGAKKSSDSVIYYALPLVVAVIKGLSCGAKGLFAVLNFNACGSDSCRVSVGSLARFLGVTRETIRGWARELERRGLIKVVHERAVCCYCLNPKYRVGLFIPLLAETMKRRGVGQTYKLVLCLLAYRQAGNDWTWAEQKALAADLGVSVRQIQRVLAGMKMRGEVQIRLRKRNRKQGNKYALTCGAVLGGRIFGAISHTTESAHLNKKRMTKTSFKALRPDFKPGDLSASGSNDGFGPAAVFSRLVSVGVHEKVARPMAFEQLHPFESVVQVINNAQILRATVWQRALNAGFERPKFSVPGYVVAALNGARREGKIVGTTRLFRDAGEKYRLIKLAKAISAKRKPPSVAKFERKRRAAIRALELLA